MAKDISLLDRVVIASPCNASWAHMHGDDKVRFCDLCKLNVYNFSAMTKPEAERLIIEKEGRLCATFYRRLDGTILTRDCPIGLRALRRGLARCVATVGTAATLLVCAGMSFVGRTASVSRLRHMDPFKRVCDWLAPPIIMGKAAGGICLRPGDVSIQPAPVTGKNASVSAGTSQITGRVQGTPPAFDPRKANGSARRDPSS